MLPTSYRNFKFVWCGAFAMLIVCLLPLVDCLSSGNATRDIQAPRRDDTCFYGVQPGDFCYDVVTWPIYAGTYVDIPSSNKVASDYYYYFLDYISADGQPTEDCKRELKFMACGRAFVRCVDKKAPELQLCRFVCQNAVDACNSPAMTFDDVKTSCRVNNKDCHAGGSSGKHPSQLALAAIATIATMVSLLFFI